jgi:LPXTG-motif cell wall-anchored protein
MNRQIQYTLYSLILAFGISEAAAQSGIRVKASADKNKIVIGEHIELRLEADIPENELIRFFLVDTIPHFEFLGKEKIDTSNTSDGTRLSQLIRITSFDSGYWVIPPFYLADSTATDSIPVDVGFSPFDPNQPYHDIKDVIDVAPEEEKEQWWWWYAIAGGALLLIILLYFLLRKKKPAVKPAAPPVDPYTEAMNTLDKLQQSNLSGKEYYSLLVDIFRQYVLKKKSISSLQKTTDDLVVQLKSLSLERESFDQLSQALRLSDFVKFAKYIPSQEDDRQAFNSIKRSIQEIEQH